MGLGPRKTVLIIRGSRGIGATTALLVAKSGYNVCFSKLQEKIMGKLIAALLLGCVLGTLLGFLGSRNLTPKVLVQGTVKYQPALTTTGGPPEGFAVDSLIYIDGLTQKDVGKPISVEGQLGLIADSGIKYYPKLFGIKKQE